MEEIAASTPRLEAMVFGMGDYSASQGIDLSLMGGENGYPGVIFHYAKFRVAMAARAQGIDAIDGHQSHLYLERAPPSPHGTWRNEK